MELLEQIEQEVTKLKHNLANTEDIPDHVMREALSQLMTLHAIYMELVKERLNGLFNKTG